METAPLTPDSGRASTRRWWIAVILLIGTWVGTLGNSMMPVALPSIVRQYGVGLNMGVWVVTVYVLLVAVLMPVFGWLGDRHGYRSTYVIGLAGLSVFSWAAALAPSFGWLIAFRALQGVFNATTLPSVMGIISQVFPKDQRGGAMGLWAAVNGAAHGLGPVISGYLIQNFAWPATFWLNGAMSLLGVVLVYAFVPSDRRHDARPFDFLGAGALTLAMLTLMFNLGRGQDLGWTSVISLGLWAVFAASVILFLTIESRMGQPFVDLGLFKNRRFSAVTAISSAQYLCLMGLPILLSLYLIQLRGFASGPAGLIIAPLASTLALFSPLAGRTADRLGYRAAMMAGMLIVTVAGLSMVLWDSETGPWLVVVTLIIIGLGMAFTQSPAATGVTLVVGEDQLGVALGIFNMLRFISGTLGATVFGITLEYARTNGGNPMQAFHLSFYLLAGVAGLATVLAVSIPRPPAPARSARD